MTGVMKINTRKKSELQGGTPLAARSFFLHTIGFDQDADHADIKSIFEYISLCI